MAEVYRAAVGCTSQRHALGWLQLGWSMAGTSCAPGCTCTGYGCAGHWQSTGCSALCWKAAMANEGRHVCRLDRSMHWCHSAAWLLAARSAPIVRTLLCIMCLLCLLQLTMDCAPRPHCAQACSSSPAIHPREGRTGFQMSTRSNQGASHSNQQNLRLISAF